MTTANDDRDDDFDNDDDQPDDDRRDRNRQGYDRRRRDKSQRDAEVADLKAKLAKYERQEALAKAKGDLKATGPLDAFLKVYDGEPTADAIKTAITKDHEFKDLITFTPDPRDEAAATQAATAAAVKGGDPIGARVLEKNVAPGTPRLQAAYAEASGAKTT